MIAFDLLAANGRLNKLEDIEISQLCLPYFPRVYEKFGDGMGRKNKILLLLDHLRRNSEELPVLERALGEVTAEAAKFPDRRAVNGFWERITRIAPRPVRAEGRLDHGWTRKDAENADASRGTF